MITELENLAQVIGASIVPVTEVHMLNPDLLSLSGYNKMMKLRPDDHWLGKKGVAIYINKKIPAFQIKVPMLNDYDEILWVFAKLKSLPYDYNGIAVCVFIIRQDKISVLKKLFLEKLQLSADYLQGKYPAGGIFLLCDTNALRLESLEARLGLKVS